MVSGVLMPIFSCVPFTCSGRVDVIEKRQCNLHELPAEVERSASCLEELYLDCNQICEIPEGLCRCKKLRSLSLGQNKILRVPPAIGSLIALEELHLEDNELSDLPEELVKCSNLKILDLRLNLLTRLPDVVTRLSSLTHLYLFETSLTQLPPDIDQLQNLRSLDVRENQLRILPPAICQLKHLRELDLGRNELSHLPLNMGSLEVLEDLYVDHNVLSAVPDSLTSCGHLRTLDVSQNDLTALPKEIGDLEQLCELSIAENRIAALPNSIGRLKNLVTLKADSNALTELVPTIGECSSLLELYLFNNQLTTLPATIGGLKELSVLSIDENQLEEIPSAIGGCSKLSILTLRGNRLRELPLEVGRLANLRVLDLCDNILAFLPFTINVLFNLRALWLSVDQTSPLVPFESAQDPVTRVKVLTTYLLPQGKCQEEAGLMHPRRVSAGVSVRFGSEEGASDEDESVGHFERKGTPHPKTRSRAVTPRRQSIDGHFIPHSDSNDNSDSTLSLRRKSAGDVPNSDGSIFQRSSQIESENSEYRSKAHHSEAEEVNGVKMPKSIMRNVSSTSRCHITIVRDAISGFGLSLAGGRDSEPFKVNDTGLFISRVVDRGPSEAAGLLVGDKILSVNGVSVVDEPHHVVAEMMQKEDKLELLVERDAVASTSYSGCHEEKKKQTQLNGEGGGPIASEEVISTAIDRDLNGSLGFEEQIDDGHVVVSSVVALSDPGKEARIQVDDLVLLTDGTAIPGAHLDLANSLTADENANEAYVVVERQQPSKLEERNTVVSLSQSSLPSTISETPTEGAFTTDTQTEASLVVDVAESSDRSVAVAALATPSAEHVTEDCGFAERFARDQPMETPLSSASSQAGAAVEHAMLTHPTPKRESPSRVGPPVAPKPKISVSGCESSAGVSSNKQQPHNKDQSSINEPEKMTLLSKIRKFESAAQIPDCDPNPNAQQVPPKKPLVSEEDVRKMKEEENKKLAAVTASFPIAVEEYIDDDLSFEHILNNNAIPSCIPRIVRTKNAERRLIAAAKQAKGNGESSDTSDIAETTLSELQKRQIWRQARYKSLEKDTAEAERMMQQVREISTRFGSIAEDGNLLENVHSTPDESTLNNGSDEDEVCATVLSDDGSELLLKTNVPSVRIST